jgi:phage terminase small subunit
MPRKSAAEMAIQTPKLRSDRLQPPATLTREEAAVFVELVINNKAEHFKPSDLPLLVTYTQIIVQLAEASKMIHKGAVHENKISPWISIQERLIKSMIGLSMRLRLSPQSRQANNPSRPTKINAYEAMATNGFISEEQ